MRTASLRSRTDPHPRILTANIFISTSQFIAALLLTCMLLWHISTITLVENYQMPEWWVRGFLPEHANGWRVGVWAVVGVLVPVDCLHALLCLDWWCAILDERESVGNELVEEVDQEGARECVHRDGGAQLQERHDSGIYALAASRRPSCAMSKAESGMVSTRNPLPHTYHPLLHPRLPPSVRGLLLDILDILVIVILAGHIVTYFVSLPTAIAFCNIPAIVSHGTPDFGTTRVQLSMRDRCIGLNVDIHVAGGFAVFVAVVLGFLHVAALVERMRERLCSGRDGMAVQHADACGLEKVERVETSTQPCTASRRFRSRAVARSGPSIKSQPPSGMIGSAPGPRHSISVDTEERSTGVGVTDWSAVRAEQPSRRRAVGTDESEAPMGNAKWSEVFLECLIDA